MLSATTISPCPQTPVVIKWPTCEEVINRNREEREMEDQRSQVFTNRIKAAFRSLQGRVKGLTKEQRANYVAWTKSIICHLVGDTLLHDYPIKHVLYPLERNNGRSVWTDSNSQAAEAVCTVLRSIVDKNGNPMYHVTLDNHTFTYNGVIISNWEIKLLDYVEPGASAAAGETKDPVKTA